MVMGRRINNQSMQVQSPQVALDDLRMRLPNEECHLSEGNLDSRADFC